MSAADKKERSVKLPTLKSTFRKGNKSTNAHQFKRSITTHPAFLLFLFSQIGYSFARKKTSWNILQEMQKNLVAFVEIDAKYAQKTRDDGKLAEIRAKTAEK